MSENEAPRVQIGFDVAELSVIRLEPGDVLSVKLIGDHDQETMESLQIHLSRVFTKNKVMVFTLPNNNDIVFEAIKQTPTEADCGAAESYCSSCNCGKKEQIEGKQNV